LPAEPGAHGARVDGHHRRPARILAASSTRRERHERRCKKDGALRFREVEGGPNQLTMRGFARIVTQIPFVFARCDLVLIRGLRFLVRNPLTREFFTSLVRCWLVPNNVASD
jgi:hypothetical protein